MSIYKKAGYLLLIVTGLFLAAQFIVPLLTDGSDLMQMYAINALVLAIGAICLPTTVFMNRNAGSFGRTKVTAPTILWSIMLGLGMFQLVSGLLNVFYEGLAALGIEPLNVSADLPPTQGWRFLASIVLIAIVPAITEEQLFRGALLQSWRSMGRWKSILLTSLLFGLFHLVPFNLPFIFGMGIVLGILAYESESVYPAMVTHGVYNLMSVLLNHVVNNSAAPAAEPTAGELWTVILMYIVIGGAITFISLKQVRKTISPRPASADERDKGVRFPVILAALILLALNVLMFAVQMGWLAL